LTVFISKVTSDLFLAASGDTAGDIRGDISVTFPAALRSGLLRQCGPGSASRSSHLVTSDLVSIRTLLTDPFPNLSRRRRDPFPRARWPFPANADPFRWRGTEPFPLMPAT